MAGRTRTTKKLAQRINLEYFKKLQAIPLWRRILSAVFATAGLAWIGWHALGGTPAIYNAGPLGHSHALLSQNCGACHVSKAGYRRSATDQACLACHDGPIHQAGQTFTPSCASCHIEHSGAMRLASTSDSACTECHAALKTTHGPSRFRSGIRGFDGTHPEFAALGSGAMDPGTVKFNHRVHLKADLRGPDGPTRLRCASCHEPMRASPGSRASSGMEAVNYERHCAACHALNFDRRMGRPAPHREPKVVYDFVLSMLTEYIAAHPAEISLPGEADMRLPARPPRLLARSASAWVVERMRDAELLLWRKSCKECHTLSYPNGAGALPAVAKAAIATRWLPHASFDHRAHQMVECESCHAKAQESQQASDVLIPGIQTCRACHRPGPNAAEARCFECHTYHDWSKEKPVPGKFVVTQFSE